MVHIRFYPLFFILFGMQVGNIYAMEVVAGVKEKGENLERFDYKEGEYLRYNGRVLVAHPQKKFKALFVDGLDLDVTKDPKKDAFEVVKKEKPVFDDKQVQSEDLIMGSGEKSEQVQVERLDKIEKIGEKSELEDLENGVAKKEEVVFEEKVVSELKNHLSELFLSLDAGKRIRENIGHDRFLRLCEKYVNNGGDLVKKNILILNKKKSANLLAGIGGMGGALETGVHDLVKASSEKLMEDFLGFICKDNTDQEQQVKTVSDKANALEATVKTEKKKNTCLTILLPVLTFGATLLIPLITSGADTGTKYLLSLIAGNSTAV